MPDGPLWTMWDLEVALRRKKKPERCEQCLAWERKHKEE